MIDLTSYGFKVVARAPQSQVKLLDYLSEDSEAQFMQSFGFEHAEDLSVCIDTKTQMIACVLTSVGVQICLSPQDEQDYKVFKHSEKLKAAKGAKEAKAKIMQNNYDVAAKTMTEAMKYVKQLTQYIENGLTIGKQHFKFHMPRDYSCPVLILPEDNGPQNVWIEIFATDETAEMSAAHTAYTIARVPRNSTALHRLQVLESTATAKFIKEILEKMEDLVKAHSVIKGMV